MTDERARELINAELDDALTTDEQSELAAILEASGEARKYRDEMRGLHRVLCDLPRLPLPDDLRAQILSGVPLGPADQGRGEPAAGAWPALVRYGLAASLGLVVAVGLYELQGDNLAGADFESMVGTMAPNAARAASDRLHVDAAGLQAEASLASANGSTVLEITLDTDAPVDIEVDLGASGYTLAALAQTAGEFEAFSFTDHVLRARSRGRQRFAVLLERDEAAVGGGQEFVGLAFSRNGKTLEQGRLQSN